MKKRLTAAVMLAITVTFVLAQNVLAYDFGDYRSETLASKAWEALEKNDMEAVLAYTNKCIELYAEQAKNMQNSLEGYVEGDNDAIFANWALNDVATCLFIQGEAYRKSEMKEEAKEVYKKIINEYTYGQAYDPKGWFWKPAKAAEEKLAMLESGSDLDFGDYSSEYLVKQAWQSLKDNKVDNVVIYTDKVLELFGDQAKEMQESLSEYPWESKEKIYSYWALNDVGTALFIKAEAMKQSGQNDQAKKAYQELVDNYFYAQCWDPNGWFWKPSDAAQQALDQMGEI